MYRKENYCFTHKCKKKNSIPRAAAFEATLCHGGFMTFTSTTHMLQWYKLKFLLLVISTKSNKQETQILPAGFYLDSKPRMQITQRCFYCEKPLVSAKHEIRGTPSTDIIQWIMAHYSVLGIVQLVFRKVRKTSKRIAYDDSLLIRCRQISITE